MRRCEIVHVCVTADERAVIADAARATEQTLSAFLRRSCLNAAAQLATEGRIVWPAVMARTPRPGWIKDEEHAAELEEKAILEAFAAAPTAVDIQNIALSPAGERVQARRAARHERERLAAA